MNLWLLATSRRVHHRKRRSHERPATREENQGRWFIPPKGMPGKASPGVRGQGNGGSVATTGWGGCTSVQTHGTSQQMIHGPSQENGSQNRQAHTGAGPNDHHDR